jgi:hypothetical protein
MRGCCIRNEPRAKLHNLSSCLFIVTRCTKRGTRRGCCYKSSSEKDNPVSVQAGKVIVTLCLVSHLHVYRRSATNQTLCPTLRVGSGSSVCATLAGQSGGERTSQATVGRCVIIFQIEERFLQRPNPFPFF